MDLDWLAKFDVISRMVGLVTTAKWSMQRRRKHHRKTRRARGAEQIVFTPPPTISGAEIEQMLKRYGVPVTDRKLVSSEKVDGNKLRTFAVKAPASQAKFARYLLLAYGVDLDGQKARVAKQGDQSEGERHMPLPWSDRRDRR